MQLRRSRGARVLELATAPLVLACAAACGSSATTAGTSSSSSRAAVGSSTSATTGPTSSGGDGGAPIGSSASSATSAAGGSTSHVSSATSASSGSSGGSMWQPDPSSPIHFHWMIGASSFTTADILTGQQGQVVYDIDGEGATAADVAAIHAAGAIAVCYVDVGSLEKGRSDDASFPPSVVGPVVAGWPNENWLIVTAANQGTILPLMKARFVDWCQAKGFDAIEPDNLDAWTNISNVSEADNVSYDLAIGALAHSLSMSIGLKNVMTDLDPSQYPSFLSTFDWALNEQCYEYSECSTYTAAGSFIPAGKAVFDVEYNVSPDCTDATQVHLNAQRTDLDLVGAADSGYSYTPCVPDAQTTW